ncbi:wall-associated receptor kinase-like 1 [Nicotiana tomentosiformis]|uniref:wall-associated receptor kinase-like 1 n=1 Tax=Nicotiana tomentosiformis TaxID=4098 RepID=UPI00051BDF08|nr:wall-associated receptor kinase-like 1 [Nicotiana tomentosiformis]
MSLKFVYLLLLLPLLMVLDQSIAASSSAKPGCEESCGNFTIPYPFGLSASCSLNSWYLIKCDRNYNPPKLFLNSFLQVELQSEVISVSLKNQTITTLVSIINFCNDSSQGSRIITTGTNLSGSPFYYSKDRNKLMLVGCGNGLVTQNLNVLSGCTSICSEGATLTGCYGINCCQSLVPFDLSLYTANFTNSGIQQGPYPKCSAAFLVDQTWVPDEVAQPFTFLGYAPVVWLWTLQAKELEAGLLCNKSGVAVKLEDGTSVANLQCHCGPRTQGNPYFSNGCQAIQGCTNCTEVVYYSKKPASTIILLSVFLSIGVLLILFGSYLLYKTFKKRRNKRQKQMFFKRNGGLLLQQQLSSNEGIIDKAKLFTAKELEKATDYFNENRILGRGGQGTVYKGMLPDGNIVAVKKSKLVDENQLDQFINEVVILSQINHRNVVKLLGCCLETEVPLLVYEFIINGTLYSFIHNENNEFPFPWSTRLRIATEVAGALAYLHSATSVPIYHRDIKSSNILLDEKYRSKVSDFGTSRSIAIDQTHLTTRVQGTFGYLDPEYFQSSQFTEKSDVYSFGVVLAELLTGNKAILTTTNEGRSLATNFLLAMDENRLDTILHAEVTQEGRKEDIMAAANVAYRCLNLNGKKRPTMKEVSIALEAIRSQVPSAAVTNFQGNTEERSVISEVNYTWTSTNTTTSSSDIHPLLFETS